jgi:hypothetical protein
MTLIEGEDLARPHVPLDDRDRKISEAEIQVRVATIQLERGFIVSAG